MTSRPYLRTGEPNVRDSMQETLFEDFNAAEREHAQKEGDHGTGTGTRPFTSQNYAIAIALDQLGIRSPVVCADHRFIGVNDQEFGLPMLEWLESRTAETTAEISNAILKRICDNEFTGSGARE